jgi:AcrR family transcriptional regulator
LSTAPEGFAENVLGPAAAGEGRTMPSSKADRRAQGGARSSSTGLDGRIRRGLRSREGILDAIYELVRSGVAQPRVEEIARKAGVGVRSVFRHFEDLERLHADMSRRVEQEVRELAIPFPPDQGPLPERVSALVKHRARMFEHIAPFRRAGQAQVHGSVFIRQEYERLAATMRADLLRVFARELSDAGDEMRDAVDVMASFETWDRLRTIHKLSRTRAVRVVETGLLRLLEIRRSGP